MYQKVLQHSQSRKGKGLNWLLLWLDFLLQFVISPSRTQPYPHKKTLTLDMDPVVSDWVPCVSWRVTTHFIHFILVHNDKVILLTQEILKNKLLTCQVSLLNSSAFLPIWLLHSHPLLFHDPLVGYIKPGLVPFHWQPHQWASLK
jgi:hypothetical protein